MVSRANRGSKLIQHGLLAFPARNAGIRDSTLVMSRRGGIRNEILPSAGIARLGAQFVVGEHDAEWISRRR
jgi:hypothetical protein